MPFLDHAAGAPLRPEARAAVLAVLDAGPGNPSGAHRAARVARRTVDDARDVVADAVGARPTEVVFTSGGTEADALAVLGVHDATGGVPVCSAIEHHAVLDPVRARAGRTAPVGDDGRVDLDALAVLLTELRDEGASVPVVSVMAVNNETGAVQPVEAVVDVVRRLAPEALVHTDAVAAAPWLDLAAVTAGCDLVSLSAHKVGGPAGVGALVVRGAAAARLAPRQTGGGQERELRAGTQNVAGIAGFGAALAATVAGRAAEAVRVGALRDRLAAGLLDAIGEARLTLAAQGGAPDPDRVAPGWCHLGLPGIESEALLVLLDDVDLAASAASACASGAQRASHVLAAMGVPDAVSRGALRLTLGWSTTDADVDAALELVPAAVARLGAYSGATP